MDSTGTEHVYKTKRSTKLGKFMKAFCERQGKKSNVVRFVFEGITIKGEDIMDSVGPLWCGGCSVGAVLS